MNPKVMKKLVIMLYLLMCSTRADHSWLPSRARFGLTPGLIAGLFALYLAFRKDRKAFFMMPVPIPIQLSTPAPVKHSDSNLYLMMMMMMMLNQLKGDANRDSWNRAASNIKTNFPWMSDDLPPLQHDGSRGEPWARPDDDPWDSKVPDSQKRIDLLMHMMKNIMTPTTTLKPDECPNCKVLVNINNSNASPRHNQTQSTRYGSGKHVDDSVMTNIADPVVTAKPVSPSTPRIKPKPDEGKTYPSGANFESHSADYDYRQQRVPKNPPNFWSSKDFWKEPVLPHEPYSGVKYSITNSVEPQDRDRDGVDQFEDSKSFGSNNDRRSFLFSSSENHRDSKYGSPPTYESQIPVRNTLRDPYFNARKEDLPKVADVHRLPEGYESLVSSPLAKYRNDLKLSQFPTLNHDNSKSYGSIPSYHRRQASINIYKDPSRRNDRFNSHMPILLPVREYERENRERIVFRSSEHPLPPPSRLPPQFKMEAPRPPLSSRPLPPPPPPPPANLPPLNEPTIDFSAPMRQRTQVHRPISQPEGIEYEHPKRHFNGYSSYENQDRYDVTSRAVSEEEADYHNDSNDSEGKRSGSNDFYAHLVPSPPISEGKIYGERNNMENHSESFSPSVSYTPKNYNHENVKVNFRQKSHEKVDGEEQNEKRMDSMVKKEYTKIMEPTFTPRKSVGVEENSKEVAATRNGNKSELEWSKIPARSPTKLYSAISPEIFNFGNNSHVYGNAKISPPKLKIYKLEKGEATKGESLLTTSSGVQTVHQ